MKLTCEKHPHLTRSWCVEAFSISHQNFKEFACLGPSLQVLHNTSLYKIPCLELIDIPEECIICSWIEMNRLSDSGVYASFSVSSLHGKM